MPPSTTNPPPTTPDLDLAPEQFAEAIGTLPESPLTEFEQNLLCGLTALAPNETAKFAEQVGLTELQLALWLKKPHIAEAHQTLREFRAQRRKSWQEEVTRDVVENLRDLMKTAEDPIERRRTASAILRAFNRPRRTRRTQGVAGAAPAHLASPSVAVPQPRPTRTWTLRPEDIAPQKPSATAAASTPPNPDPPAPTSVASSLSRSVASPTTQHNADTQNLNPRDRVGADQNQPASHRPRSSASPRDPRGPAPGRSRQASARPPPLPL